MNRSNISRRDAIITHMTSMPRSKIRTGGDADLAFAVVVLASYFATFSGMRNASSIEIILMIGLGTAYLGLGIYGYAYCAQSDSLLLQLVYFGLQVPLGGMIVYLGHGAGFNAMVLFPLAGHAVVLISQRAAYVVNILIVLAYIIANYAFTGSWELVWAGFPTFMAGVIFIVVFTQMTVSEESSRREVERLVSELTVANQRLREYALQAEDMAVTQERNRLAREIHDGLGHYLTTVHMQLQAAKAVWEVEPEKAVQMLDKAQTLTQEALVDVRQSVGALRISSNDYLNLSAMIQKILDSTQSLEIHTHFTVVGEEREINPQAKWTLFRAAQEGLNNTCKHAKAENMWIELVYSDPKSVTLKVNDDGLGSQNLNEGFGLLGIKERVSLLNGSLAIDNNSDFGFSFRIVIPT